MADSLLDRMAWCLRNYKNAAKQSRTVSTDVVATAEESLRQYDLGVQQDQEDADRVLERANAPKARI